MDKELISEAARQLEVQGVTVKEGFFTCGNEYSSVPTSEHGFQAYNATVNCEEFETDNGQYAYIFTYSVGIRSIKEDDGSDDPDVLMEIKAKFEATYLSQKEVDANAISEFGKCNVGYHVWPYWREFVQSSCVRMDIPIVTVPFYRIG